jgi:hypothetical protein
MVMGVSRGYEPDSPDYTRGLSLVILADRPSEIRIIGRAMGSKFRGLIGFMAFCYWDSDAPRQEASETPFQVNYAEPYESVER